MKIFTTLLLISLFVALGTAEASNAYVDHIRITVYYTEASGASQVQIRSGVIVNPSGLVNIPVIE